MNLKPQRREDPDVNLTPLIDVVFLLLIFFMVSTTFKHASELEIELPESSARPVRHERKALELVIDAQGRYYLGEQAVVNTRLPTLVRALQQAVEADPDRPFVIRADAQTPHQAVVTAMDAAAQVGIERVSIATTTSPSDAEEAP
ncbi:MAG TPA: biopolymer transporter ExbD [Thiotrichales bacterium]|nr:biopolymer transporter ExbD [Thiotrichales bacterium]